jgi:hypothetical protein
VSAVPAFLPASAPAASSAKMIITRGIGLFCTLLCCQQDCEQSCEKATMYQFYFFHILPQVIKMTPGESPQKKSGGEKKALNH